MRVYELMSLLGKAEADREIKVVACLTLQELMSGQQIDKDCFCLAMDIDDFDPIEGIIGTLVRKERQ